MNEFDWFDTGESGSATRLAYPDVEAIGLVGAPANRQEFILLKMDEWEFDETLDASELVGDEPTLSVRELLDRIAEVLKGKKADEDESVEKGKKKDADDEPEAKGKKKDEDYEYPEAKGKKRPPVCKKCGKRHWPFEPCPTDEKAEDRVAEFAERLRRAEEQVAHYAQLVERYERERRFAECVKFVASELGALPGKPEETAEILILAEDAMEKDQYDRLVGLLKAASKGMETLYSELGTTREETAEDPFLSQVRKKAAELRSNTPDMSEEVAFSEAFKLLAATDTDAAWRYWFRRCES